MKFWSDGWGPTTPVVYRTRGRRPMARMRGCYLLFDSDEPATTNAAEHILGIFMERLG